MPIRFVCPPCGSNLLAPDHTVGRKGRCPNCGRRVTIVSPKKRGPASRRSFPVQRSAERSARASAADRWFFRKLLHPEEQGPVTYLELAQLAREDEIGPFTLVWRGSAGRRLFACKVQGLFDDFIRGG
jgi:hypothetical protein